MIFVCPDCDLETTLKQLDEGLSDGYDLHAINALFFDALYSVAISAKNSSDKDVARKAALVLDRLEA